MIVTGVAQDDSVARTGLSPAGALTDEVWPGLADPAGLLSGITDWLTGYGNRQTRRTYAEGLGLPVSAADIAAAWTPTGTPSDARWSAAVAAYADAVVTAPASGRTGPPPAGRGRLRSWHWLRWCAARGVDPTAATSAHVKAWLGELDEAGAAPSTRDRMLATVKTLYAFLADAGLVAANPAALDRRRLGLTAAAASTSATITLTSRQVAALHRAAGAPRRGAGACDVARAVAIVSLFTLGLRVSELCGLDEADLHVTRGRRALRVRGKGGKVRVVYLSVPAENAVLEYANLRGDGAGTAIVAGVGRAGRGGDRPLLVTRGGRRFARQAIWQLLRRVAAAAGPELAGVAEVMHPHALRHFYVTAAVEAGASLEHVQADVGHASIDTTSAVYDHAARDPARSAVDLVADAWHPSS
ncbi:tyrosine-type recombinase/integrase [Amycolatopsis sp. CB00013]|uniref:tyrosine-type recombinase/integrase n=1 Tax=Amycolatopsis sp. CB00013 TaxID=1703945 RepID=UPI00093F2654|nr:tyrosine-type recombinase/integrase [Amycolatopsis sp. CB00013]OKK01855.1 integrase [Amycolatopsis sp. CB00013]